MEADNSLSDSNIKEYKPGSQDGLVGYDESVCSNKVCVTIDQNFGKNNEIKVLESTAWTAPLAYRIKCFLGAKSEDQAVEHDWTFCSTGKCLPCFKAKDKASVDAIASGKLYYTSDTYF